MKIAIIGSRNIVLDDLGFYLKNFDVTEIVSGGAKGVDSYAAQYARENNIPLTEFLPDYERYKRGAPLKRNDQIIDYADHVIAFWDTKSKGTKYVIERCKKLGKMVTVFIPKADDKPQQ
ncbi:MAG: DUF2493 domain-containing protein [Ruminococcaceae bacterium]|nr:DUF2493 domain-containing protein [Oscillospiraceae bacterium]